MHRTIVMAIAGLLLANAVSALQIRPVRDNQTVSAKISSRELSRIFVRGDRIQAARGVKGAYELMKDEREGMLFIRPSSHYPDRPFSLFVTTAQGHTYSLLLVPVNIPSESIGLVPLSPSRNLACREKNSPWTDLLVQLINSMAEDRQPEGYVRIPVRGKVIRTSGFCMQQVSVFRGSRLQGEGWCIRNQSGKILRLTPAMFFHERVHAIALERETVEAGDETRLYRVISHE